jgi:hypothetical protein
MKTELEEAAEKYSMELLEAKTIQPHEKSWVESIFAQGAKWQQERMYSEEDMRKAFEAGELSKEDEINGDGETSFEQWFEQNKKN